MMANQDKGIPTDRNAGENVIDSSNCMADEVISLTPPCDGNSSFVRIKVSAH
jgi:hypothetical protein